MSRTLVANNNPVATLRGVNFTAEMIINLRRRLENKVAVAESGCHEFQGTIAYNGYGEIFLARTAVRGRIIKEKAHRVAYFCEFGEIGQGLFVCHKCDNRKCVNVDHLFLGSAADNLRDMIAKGRGFTPPKFSGSAHPNARLDEKKIAIIKGLKGVIPYTKIASSFHISRSAVANVLWGNAWPHVSALDRVSAIAEIQSRSGQ